MKANSGVVVSLGIFLLLVGLSSCTPASKTSDAQGETDSPTAPALVTLDQTATAVGKIIELALSATPQTAIASGQTARPDLDATQTADGQRAATAVAATLTAQPTSTPTTNAGATETTEAQRLATMVAATLADVPTATPNFAATQTTQAQLKATAVAATLTAQPANTPTATPTEDIFATQTVEANQLATAVAATLTAQPTTPSFVINTPQRIRFARGSTSATFIVHLTENIAQAYILGVSAGQQITVDVNNFLELHAFDPNRNELMSVRSDSLRWQFVATETGDYIIVLKGTGDVTVTIYIPPL